MDDTSQTSTEDQTCHQHHAESQQEQVGEIILVSCPKHGEHEHTIVSNIEGHEGAWCQLCWLESLGPSLPSRTKT